VTQARRVRVTHPRTEAARRAPSRPLAREIDEQTHVGEIYMRSLIRSQARLALTVCVAATLLLGGIALAGTELGRLTSWAPAGVPLPWLILGVLVYPAFLALGWYTVRQAERNENAFTDLTKRR